MFKFLLILSLFTSVSCTSSHMTLSGRDGRTGVVRKQTPEFNKRYMEKQRRFGGAGNVRSNRARPEIKNNEDRRSVQQNIEESVIAKNSTAYTSRSVLDKNKNSNGNIGKIVEKNSKLNDSVIKESKPKVKDLEDFNYIPDDVFDDMYMIENNDRNRYSQDMEFVNSQYMNDDSYIKSERTDDKKWLKSGSSNGNNCKKSWWKFWSKNENTQDCNSYLSYDDFNDTYGYHDDNYYNMQYNNEQEQYYNGKRYNGTYNNRINNNYSEFERNNGVVSDNSRYNRSNNVSERYTRDMYNKNLKRDYYQDQQLGYKGSRNNNYVDYQDNYSDGYYNNNHYDNSYYGSYNDHRADLQRDNYLRNQEKYESFQQSNNYLRNNTSRQNNSISSSVSKVPSQSTKLIKDKYYVQVIYTKNKSSCDSVLAKLDAKNTGIVQTVNVNGSTYYKGLIGPYSTQAQANLEKERIINMGHYDVFTFKER